MSTIPPWHAFLKPVLEVMSDGRQWPSRALKEAVCDHVGLTEQQRAEVVLNGDPRAVNRVGWAMSALYRAKAIDKPARGVNVITDFGRQFLVEHPGAITDADVKSLPVWSEYEPTPRRSNRSAVLVDRKFDESDDPTELIEAGIQSFEADTAAELIRRLQGQHPDFFEQVVVDLLNAMGYGGAEQRGQRIGRSGDGGVDGVIDQDALGLSQIYVQAKRYAADNAVQRPELQGFIGALAGRGASQGVFVTTSRFSPGARDYAASIPQRIVLIDGPRLAELMIQYRVGVQVKKSYDVVEVDEDYFD
ncbi:restriction endonuclease [Yonghaparkia sp. Root332]|uniref:restriction endonuclease n=1 Tax=Yonghaparkia sp. Root332 TaxID=1736516 RepID=UPI0019108A07|nr:restriction endonuclease [Yonghaparkia sp. Root332]